MRLLYTLIVCLLSVTWLAAQNNCNDPLAKNTNAAGNCEYKKKRKIFRPTKNIPSILNETSGLISWADGLWTFNDSGADTAVYKIDPQTGQILQTIYITNALNSDWEDISQDAEHIYIGDFGNNRGQRKDLSIYKIKKSDIQPDTKDVTAEKITFYYPEQKNFSNRKNHHWDCEAFINHNGAFHFFTKNRDNAKTYHYIIPNTTGNHAAQLVDSLDVQCQITAADINFDGTIVLIGYTPFKLFMWIVWNYDENSFFSGNARKIRMGNFIVHGQAEGICFTQGKEGYISAEGHKRRKQHIKKFNLNRFISDAAQN